MPYDPQHCVAQLVGPLSTFTKGCAIIPPVPPPPSVIEPERATFVILGAVTPGDDVTQTRHIVTKNNRTPTHAAMNAGTPPTTVNLVADISYQGVSIFGATKLVLATGQSTDAVGIQTTFASVTPNFSQGTVLKLNVLQAGGAADIKVVLEY